MSYCPLLTMLIKSPKQHLETYCFCSVFYYYYYYYSPSPFFLSFAKFQQCPISYKLAMWVDYDVLNLLPTWKNF